MDWTILNTIVTIVSIVVGVVGISAFLYYLFPKLWRKKYLSEHNPTPHFEQEMKYGGIYVQPKIEMEDKSKKKIVKLLRDYFFDEVFVKGTKNGERVFCILGDTGMGKTAALVNLFVDYVKHYRKGNIPYDIWLFSLADQNVFEKIKAIENKGKSILLLDAVDENSEAKDDNDYDKFIKKLEQAYQDFAFVVTTCRPQFFGDESEVFDSTNARRNGFFLKCKRLDLVPFDDDQVREYLFNLYYHEPNQKLKQEAEKIVKKCPQIAQRPLVLSFIKELVDDDRVYKNTLDIYDAIVTSLIRREVEKTSPKADENMMRQWRDLLSEVAGFMYKNRKLSISKEEYEGILFEHNLKTTEDKKTFRQRSLLTRTAEGFQFSHKSFYEYFMAYRFFVVPDEIASIQDMDFALRLLNELYFAYIFSDKTDKGTKHFGIGMMPQNNVIESIIKVGSIFPDLNIILEMERYLQSNLDILRQLAESSPQKYMPELASKLNYLGLLHSFKGKHADAEKEYLEALKINRQLVKASPETYLPYVAEILYNLGNLHRDTDKHGDAVREYGEALEIRRQLAEASPETFLPDVARTLFNIAFLRMKQGNLSNAEKMAQESLKKYQTMAKLSPEAFNKDVDNAKSLLEIIHTMQAVKLRLPDWRLFR